MPCSTAFFSSCEEMGRLAITMCAFLSRNDSKPFPALDPVTTIRDTGLASINVLAYSSTWSEDIAAPFTLMATLDVSCANEVDVTTVRSPIKQTILIVRYFFKSLLLSDSALGRN